jgi:hypothetical protein
MHKIPAEELDRKTVTWLALPGLKLAWFAQAAIHRDGDASIEGRRFASASKTSSPQMATTNRPF